MTGVTLRRGDAVLAGERSGEGPPVLLLHAGGERRSVWRPVSRVLEGHGYRCTSYDLRGHGDSDPTGADELSTHVADVVAMIAAEAHPPVVVGASIGGLAALVALNRTPPAHVAGLVLVDVVPHLDPARVRAHLNGVADGYGEHPLVVDVLRGRAALEATTEGLAGVPTLLVRGQRSPLTDSDIAWFRARVPHGVVATVPGAGHLVARDAPALLADVLRTHLGSAVVRRRRIDHVLATGAAQDISHPGGSLHDHVNRTGDLLESWGAPGWVVDAGRLHAAHGTDGFPYPIPGVTPEDVLAAVGRDAADLVALYGSCDRSRTHPTLHTDRPVIVDRHTRREHRPSSAQLRAFAELTAANELDVVEHDPRIATEHGPALTRLVERLAPLLSPAATAAWSATRMTEV